MLFGPGRTGDKGDLLRAGGNGKVSAGWVPCSVGRDGRAVAISALVVCIGFEADSASLGAETPSMTLMHAGVERAVSYIRIFPSHEMVVCFSAVGLRFPTSS